MLHLLEYGSQFQGTEQGLVQALCGQHTRLDGHGSPRSSEIWIDGETRTTRRSYLVAVDTYRGWSNTAGA